MKIPAAKIELAATQEQSRYAMSAVKLDVEAKAFIATDGHILACVPAEVDADDHSALIGLDTMKAIRAFAKQQRPFNTEVRTNGKVTAECAASKSEFPLVEGTFPNWEAVKPPMAGSATVSLDAALLLKLAQAISGENTAKRAVVKLWIKDANSGIGVRVSGSGEAEAWGVIMPTRL